MDGQRTHRLGPALAVAMRISFDDAAADWFPPVAASMDRLDPEGAAAGAPGTNPPWRVLRHLQVGYGIWGRYLATGEFEPAAFGGGREWDEALVPSGAALDALRARLRAGDAAFRATLASLDDDELLEPKEAMGGATLLDIVLSNLAHLGYHAGELAMIDAVREAARPGVAPVPDGSSRA